MITCRAYMDHSYLTQPQGRKQREVQSPYAAKMNSKFFKNGFSSLDCNSISNANYQMIGIDNAYMRGKSPITNSIICASSQVSWFGTIENNRKVRASRCKNYKVHNS